MLAVGAWLKRGGVRRRLLVGAAGTVVVAAGASVGVALGGSPTPAAPPSTSSAPVQRPTSVAMPAQCRSLGCTKAQTADLGNGYSISLWHSGKAGDFRSEPVIGLSNDGIAVQWWSSPRGYGWAGSLTCATRAPEPNCMLTDGDGAHSAVAQSIVLRAGRLVASAKAVVVADLPTVLARDLDRDGYLDVIAVDNDYTPNFAQGRLYWHTFRYADGRLVSTGCARKGSPNEPAPAQPVTGDCPRL